MDSICNPYVDETAPIFICFANPKNFTNLKSKSIPQGCFKLRKGAHAAVVVFRKKVRAAELARCELRRASMRVAFEMPRPTIGNHLLVDRNRALCRRRRRRKQHYDFAPVFIFFNKMHLQIRHRIGKGDEMLARAFIMPVFAIRRVDPAQPQLTSGIVDRIPIHNIKRAMLRIHHVIRIPRRQQPSKTENQNPSYHPPNCTTTTTPQPTFCMISPYLSILLVVDMGSAAKRMECGVFWRRRMDSPLSLGERGGGRVWRLDLAQYGYRSHMCGVLQKNNTQYNKKE